MSVVGIVIALCSISILLGLSEIKTAINKLTDAVRRLK